MRNQVYGLVSMVILPSGEKVKDGTLLFSNKEKADKFLEFVSHLGKQTQVGTHMKGSNVSHYEHGQEYIVSNSIADFVNTKSCFFVSQIEKHLLDAPIEASKDVVLSSISFNTQEVLEDKQDNNIIDI